MSSAWAYWWTDPPSGFLVTHLSCLPCGERVEVEAMTGDELREWVLKHDEHIREQREMLEERGTR